MPEMIPKPYRGEVSSERKVYSYLEECALSGFAIHNVKYESPRQHEADFIIITKKGILVLEVKGGLVEWNRQEGWTTTNRYNVKEELKKSPYEQAFYNIKNIQDRMKQDLPDIDMSKILWAYGVVLPDTNELPDTIEMIRKITFAGLDDPAYFLTFLNGCFDYAMSKVDQKRHPSGFGFLNEAMMNRIKEYLCGCSGIIRDLKRDINATEERIIVATKEQYKLLGLLRDVDRYMVKGGAGTGKTLIALEHAENLAKKGLRVLFLTYNKLLKQYLKKETGSQDVDFINFDSLIFNSIATEAEPHAEGQSWTTMDAEQSRLACNQHRPNAFIRQGGLPGSKRYDAVIVDEAQDVLDLRRRLQCIDLMVKGGLAKGRITFFYDASQHIFNTGEVNELEEAIGLLRGTYGFAHFTLSENCRNTAQIAEFARQATGFGDPPGETAINSAFSVDVSYYSNQEEKMARLVEIASDLKDKGIEGGDILILSHRKAGNADSSLTHASVLDGIYATRLLDPNAEYEENRSTIKMSNIYSYKGLQEKIVIVTDVDRLEDEGGRPQRENYACFTRAKAKLYVIADSAFKPRLDEIAASVE